MEDALEALKLVASIHSLCRDILAIVDEIRGDLEPEDLSDTQDANYTDEEESPADGE